MTGVKEVEVLNHILFGGFVKKWSNGTLPRPNTIGEFEHQVGPDIVVIGTGYDRSANVHYCLLPPTSEKVSFVIPDESDVAQQPPPGETYPLPEFYGDLAFDGSEADVPQDMREIFRSCRIADYCAGKCM